MPRFSLGRVTSAAAAKECSRTSVYAPRLRSAGSLLGGWIASLTSTRLSYFLTVPFAVLSALAYLRFREPQLHKTGDRSSLRRHLAVTFRTLTQRGQLLPIITLAVLTSVILQLILEFGPLWLLALAAPAILYGPYWAGLMSTFGLGGLLAGRLQLDKPTTVGGTVALSHPATSAPQDLHPSSAKRAADRIHRGALVAKRVDLGPDNVSHRKISRRAII